MKLKNFIAAGLERPGDQHTHNFVRPAVNPLHAGIGIHAADRILVHIPVPAEKLQASVDGARHEPARAAAGAALVGGRKGV